MGIHYSISIDDSKNEFIINYLDYDLMGDIAKCLNLKYVEKPDEVSCGYKPIKLTKSKAIVLVDKLKNILVKIENNSYVVEKIEKDIAKVKKENVKEFKKYKKKYGRLNAHMKFFKSNRLHKSYLRLRKKDIIKLKGGWPDKYKKENIKNTTQGLIMLLERLIKNNYFSKSKISLEIAGAQGHWRFTRKEAKERWAVMKKENPKQYELHMKYRKRWAKRNKTKFKPL